MSPAEPVILHVIPSLDPRSGGPSRALVGLSSAQRLSTPCVRIASNYRSHNDPALVAALTSAGVDVRMIGPCFGPFSWCAHTSATLSGLIPSAKVVHIHGIWLHIQHVAAKLSLRSGVPYVIRPCGMLDPWSLSRGRLRKRLYMSWRQRADLNGAAALHFTSEQERASAEFLKLTAASIVEPNGIDLQEFDQLPTKGAFRRRQPKVGSRRFALHLGRLHPKKGLDLLLRSFAKANLDHHDTALVLAGPDENNHRQKLEALAKQCGIADRVIFTGYLNGAQRIEALVDASVFVLPSRHENFGVAVLEAMAAGLPVIVSDQVALHREVSRKGLGTVIQRTTRALSAALASWISQEERCLTVGASAREYALERYDWQKIALRWDAHYQELQKHRARP